MRVSLDDDALDIIGALGDVYPDSRIVVDDRTPDGGPVNRSYAAMTLEDTQALGITHWYLPDGSGRTCCDLDPKACEG